VWTGSAKGGGGGGLETKDWEKGETRGRVWGCVFRPLPSVGWSAPTGGGSGGSGGMLGHGGLFGGLFETLWWGKTRFGLLGGGGPRPSKSVHNQLKKSTDIPNFLDGTGGTGGRAVAGSLFMAWGGRGASSRYTRQWGPQGGVTKKAAAGGRFVRIFFSGVGGEVVTVNGGGAGFSEGKGHLSGVPWYAGDIYGTGNLCVFFLVVN